MSSALLDVRIEYSVHYTDFGIIKYTADLCEFSTSPFYGLHIAVQVMSVESFEDAKEKALAIYRLKKTGTPATEEISYKTLWDTPLKREFTDKVI